MQSPLRLDAHDALIVIDVQNDFCTGTLAIEGFGDIIAPINALAASVAHVVVATDWHPADHISFASRHPGARPGDRVAVSYGTQPVHADHCVQDTPGAALHPDLRLSRAGLILRKGMNRDVDSYSAFVENDRIAVTGLAGALHARGVRRVFVTGLALYGCVAASALDARAAGFDTWLVVDASRGRPNPARAAELHAAGVSRVHSGDIVA